MSGITVYITQYATTQGIYTANVVPTSNPDCVEVSKESHVTLDQIEPSHVVVNVQEGGTWVFVLCRKDAFCERWFAVAEAIGAQLSLKEYHEFDNPDAAASEAAKQLFDLTARFTPGAHREIFGETKRTPEVVLRAMLKAYQDAALEKAMAYFNSNRVSDLDKSIAADKRVVAVRDALAVVLCGRGVKTDVSSPVGVDYEKRLAGERPLDAPPLEAP